MANPAPHAAPPATPAGDDRIRWTTRRGLATWSFAAGIWSLLVFWWYPFGLFLASVGMVMGLIALARGWRGGQDGENLALCGVIMCSITIGAALTVFRGMQLFFGDLDLPIVP